MLSFILQIIVQEIPYFLIFCHSPDHGRSMVRALDTVTEK